ncbi:dTDP-4-dehydrorhamnose reductase [Pusillimonas minor]|uniref:dTDP-4-dehydrorhamnose reductase n=1 Tax=Pusillimonas minor TaxID=2697024 RepID=A0A842HM17_9BURK|nr:dTDP-4-dehydrorhamnose reductase [Pusillimonas minor]MBC2769849.1 dTDP-4-dehydrorhamnose reductase [Pusillimonas minor]
MLKLLLTGANGQVGFELRRSLAVLGDVLAVDQAQCDLSNPAAIRQLVQNYRPNVIVNPAAYTAVDQAESNPLVASAVNADAVQVLGEEAQKIGALVVHYSTDYVFDGRKDGAYTELDPTNPQSVYGATKLAGELALQATGARHLILRTSWVVGAHGGNFAKTMIRLAAQRHQLSIVADQFGVPTSAALLADITAHLVREHQTSGGEGFTYGTYHAVAGGVTNWHEYACYVIERARAAGRPVLVAPDAILPITTADYPTPAQRPANSRLATAKLQQTFGLHLPHWRSGVDHILDQIL